MEKSVGGVVARTINLSRRKSPYIDHGLEPILVIVDGSSISVAPEFLNASPVKVVTPSGILTVPPNTKLMYRKLFPSDSIPCGNANSFRLGQSRMESFGNVVRPEDPIFMLSHIRRFLKGVPDTDESFGKSRLRTKMYAPSDQGVDIVDTLGVRNVTMSC